MGDESTAVMTSLQPSQQVLRDDAKSPCSDKCGSSQSHQEYLDSLKPPSKDKFNRIAEIQQTREHEHKLQVHERERPSVELTPHTQKPGSGRRAPGRSGETSTSHIRPTIVDDLLLTRAATLIQRTYRGYRVRRQMAGFRIDAGTMWKHALREARFREITKPRPRGESSSSNTAELGDRDPQERHAAAMRNWRKAAIVARKAGWDEDSASGSDPDDSSSLYHSDMDEEQREAMRKRRAASRAKRKQLAKTMGLQYFLEMVDQKHRYGSNLRTYHEEWKKSNTHENFFYWLDYGEGRFVEMEACPRDRLQWEQVRYLSREERQYYLVKIDKEGRLCWAKNNAKIDTTEEWKDSIYGIVPKDDTTPAFSSDVPDGARPDNHNTGNGGGSNQVESDGELEAARAAKYATPGLDEAKGLKKVSHISAATIFNKLLRKSVKKNTWIFVADTSFRLYIGIKDSGAFQHSSFLQGGRISAAGLIKIKNGRLKSLSPLSGHYRPPAANFRAFVQNLKETGVDMTHVSISKSYAVLVGLEVYVRTRQKSKDLVNKLMHGKDKIVAPDEVAQRREEERDKTESAAKERAFLEKEAMEREENKKRARVMKKLHIGPRSLRAEGRDCT